MLPSESIATLKRQREEVVRVLREGRKSPGFTKWRRDTEIAIERIFGPSTRHLIDFRNIDFQPSSYSMSNAAPMFDRAFEKGMDNAKAVLDSMIDEIDQYGLVGDLDLGVPDQLSLIERLCLRFHSVARQLQSRREGRPTLTIEDEYDVQDLLHALLKVHFDDIRKEEWTPSYAGSSSRVDFLLKIERIVIEVKKTRSSLTERKLGEELIIDRHRYQAHPDCDALVCFVYDPEGRIGNPAGIERDLELQEPKFRVRIIIAPKNSG